MSNSPTILDIAARAGVSKSTVSRVLSRSGGAVSPESRARVERAAQELHYSPNAIAQAMKTKHTGTITFWLCGGYTSLTADPFYAHVIEGIIRQADALGLDLLLSASAPTAALASRRLLSKKADGILLASWVSQDIIDAFCKWDIPVVLVNYFTPDERICCVTMDDYRNTAESVEFLLAKGHRRIAFICGSSVSFSHMERLRAYRDTLARHDIRYDERLVRHDYDEPGFTLVESGRELMRDLLQEDLQFSAALVVNDYMAAGALQAVRAANLRVPEDLALMGYDDLDCAEFLDPPLTTYKVDKEALGREAVRQLCCRMEGKPSPQHIIMEGKGVVRRQSV